MQNDVPAKSMKRAERRKDKAIRHPGDKRSRFRSNRWRRDGLSGKPLLKLASDFVRLVQGGTAESFA